MGRNAGNAQCLSSCPIRCLFFLRCIPFDDVFFKCNNNMYTHSFIVSPSHYNNRNVITHSLPYCTLVAVSCPAINRSIKLVLYHHLDFTASLS